MRVFIRYYVIDSIQDLTTREALSSRDLLTVCQDQWSERYETGQFSFEVYNKSFPVRLNAHSVLFRANVFFGTVIVGALITHIAVVLLCLESRDAGIAGIHHKVEGMIPSSRKGIGKRSEPKEAIVIHSFFVLRR